MNRPRVAGVRPSPVLQRKRSAAPRRPVRKRHRPPALPVPQSQRALAPRGPVRERHPPSALPDSRFPIPIPRERPRAKASAASLALLVVALAAVPGCSCGSDSVNRGDLNVVSLDDEWALGEELAAEVDAQIAVHPDKEVQRYVDALGAALAAETELADRTWTFTAVADPTVNAFALPGGHVYVHSGLIAAAGTEAELASVVGHEVAHVAARHATERMVKAQGLSVVATLVLGRDPGLIQQIVAAVVGQGALAGFSRGDEREADALGLAYMAAAGFDPDGMAAMFETLVALREREPGRFERWFGTHPLGEERVAQALEAAEALPPGGARDSERFRAVRARVQR